MKQYLPAALFCSLGLATGFLLGTWYAAESRSVSAITVAVAAQSAQPPPATAQSSSADSTAGGISRTELAQAYALPATDPRAALDSAMTLPDAARLPTMQSLMAAWLRTDRLAAAEWMNEKRGLQEFEPLSAQVSDAFFPDDTEMSAMFSFNLTDASLRDSRVNRLVAYWKSGAHLKFDNSPWEVDGPGVSSAAALPTSAVASRSPEASPANAQPEQAIADTTPEQPQN